MGCSWKIASGRRALISSICARVSGVSRIVKWRVGSAPAASSDGSPTLISGDAAPIACTGVPLSSTWTILPSRYSQRRGAVGVFGGGAVCAAPTSWPTSFAPALAAACPSTPGSAATLPTPPAPASPPGCSPTASAPCSRTCPRGVSFLSLSTASFASVLAASTTSWYTGDACISAASRWRRMTRAVVLALPILLAPATNSGIAAPNAAPVPNIHSACVPSSTFRCGLIARCAWS